MECADDNDKQMRICSKAQLMSMKKTKIQMDDEGESSIIGIDVESEDKKDKNKHYHQLYEVHRREDESASNHYQRSRASRKHPYFLSFGSPATDNFLIMEYDPETANQLPIFTSKSGHKYMYDEMSPWWNKLDKKLVQRFLLRQHKLKKLHKRIVAQQDMVQNVLRNQQIPGCKDLRLSAGDEFKIASSAAEYLNLVVMIKEERNVWKKNKALIQNDIKSSDYEQGEWNNLYERRCRLPRFVLLFVCLQKKLIVFVNVFFFVLQKKIVQKIKLIKQKLVILIQKQVLFIMLEWIYLN